MLLTLIIQSQSICFATPGHVESLTIQSNHGENPIPDAEIQMSWDYPSGYTSTTISMFYYAFNTSSTYTISTSDSTTTERMATSDILSNKDNIAYYFHIAALDNDFIIGPNLGPTKTEGPMRIDNVAPLEVSISGPETTDTIYNVSLSLSATGAILVCVSNSGPGIGCEWIPITSQINNWTLTQGEGIKTVYAQFKDTAGNISSASTNIEYIPSNEPENTIPTLTEWGMIFFMMTLLLCALIRIKSTYTNKFKVNSIK